MGKKTVQLLGFAYGDSKSDLKAPEAAIIVDTAKGAEITSRTASVIPLNEFKLMVANNDVRDMKLKDNELVLTAMRKGLRSGGVEATQNALGALGTATTELALLGGTLYGVGQEATLAGAKQAAVAATSQASTLGRQAAAAQSAAFGTLMEADATVANVTAESASAAFDAMRAGGMSAKEAYHAMDAAAAASAEVAEANAAREASRVAYESTVKTARAAANAAEITKDAAGVAVEEAEVAAGSLHWLLPAVVIGTVAASLYVTTKAVTGVATRGKVYEYVPVRMISEHMKRANESSKHIAACVAGFQRQSNTMLITLFLYGDGVRDFLIKVMKDFPQLGGNIALPEGSFTSIAVPYALLARPEFFDGFHLMFSTINFHDAGVCTNIVKQTKFSREQVLKIADFFDTVTAESLAAETVAFEEKPTVSKEDGLSNVAAYCKKYGMTEEQFRETEVPRLCAILGCDENSIEEKVGELVYD